MQPVEPRFVSHSWFHPLSYTGAFSPRIIRHGSPPTAATAATAAQSFSFPIFWPGSNQLKLLDWNDVMNLGRKYTGWKWRKGALFLCRRRPADRRTPARLHFAILFQSLNRLIEYPDVSIPVSPVTVRAGCAHHTDPDTLYGTHTETFTLVRHALRSNFVVGI